MKSVLHKVAKFFYSFLTILLVSISMAYSQADSTKIIPHPITQNAGFDVIVKVNGELVYGLVKEVGSYFISYQRTDIPDGPVYTIPRNEVYVISYRNQVKDYINPIDMPSDNFPHYRYINYHNKKFFENGSVHVGLGFLRSFTKVKDVKNYSSSASFPVISIGYEVTLKSNLDVGLQLGFGGHKFSDQRFSSYDSTQNDISLKENIFALYAYGRYYFLKGSSRLQPYILAGLGIASSNIHSENKISFTNDNSQIIIVKSGSRSTGLGVVARIGAEYYINNQLQVFLDAGAGLSVINVGLAVNIK